MAVKLRLTRLGAKKKPFYRIVAIDSRKPRDGEYIDLIGTYNPISQPKEIKINHEKAKYWLSEGAQLSERVRYLFVNEGILKTSKNANQKIDDSDAVVEDNVVADEKVANDSQDTKAEDKKTEEIGTDG